VQQKELEVIAHRMSDKVRGVLSSHHRDTGHGTATVTTTSAGSASGAAAGGGGGVHLTIEEHEAEDDEGCGGILEEGGPDADSGARATAAASGSDSSAVVPNGDLQGQVKRGA